MHAQGRYLPLLHVTQVSLNGFLQSANELSGKLLIACIMQSLPVLVVHHVFAYMSAESRQLRPKSLQQVSHDKIGSIPLGSFVAVSAKAKCGCCRVMSMNDAAEAIKKCRRCAWCWASFCAHAQVHGVMLARRLLQGDGPRRNENLKSCVQHNIWARLDSTEAAQDKVAHLPISEMTAKLGECSSSL